MKRIFLIVLTLSFINCSNNDNPISINKNITIENYYYGYMQYPQGILANPQTDNLVKINYNEQNVITRRIGGLISVNPVTGFNYTFSNEIYDSISRSSNTILIERKTSSSNFQIAEFKRTLFINQEGKITFKVIETTFPTTKDTIDYQYNSIGKIIKTNSRNQLTPKESYFYYNSNQNLDSIVSFEYNGSQLNRKTLEVFKNYDNSTNPVKNLNIFEETFNRSLTENNYSEYEKKVFNLNNDLISKEQKTWNFTYDNNEIIQFNVF